MSNPKTIPSPTKPESHDGWIRKSELDEYLGRNLPIPTQVVSNEEFYPLPQTPGQHAVENHLLRTAAQNAKIGMDRRQFLGTSCGMPVPLPVFLSVSVPPGVFGYMAADFNPSEGVLGAVAVKEPCYVRSATLTCGWLRPNVQTQGKFPLREWAR